MAKTLTLHRFRATRQTRATALTFSNFFPHRSITGARSLLCAAPPCGSGLVCAEPCAPMAPLILYARAREAGALDHDAELLHGAWWRHHDQAAIGRRLDAMGPEHLGGF